MRTARKTKPTESECQINIKHNDCGLTIIALRPVVYPFFLLHQAKRFNSFFRCYFMLSTRCWFYIRFEFICVRFSSHWRTAEAVNHMITVAIIMHAHAKAHTQLTHTAPTAQCDFWPRCVIVWNVTDRVTDCPMAGHWAHIQFVYNYRITWITLTQSVCVCVSVCVAVVSKSRSCCHRSVPNGVTEKYHNCSQHNQMSHIHPPDPEIQIYFSLRFRFLAKRKITRQKTKTDSQCNIWINSDEILICVCVTFARAMPAETRADTDWRIVIVCVCSFRLLSVSG